MEVISGAITLFGGMLFVDQQTGMALFNIITFVVILIYNCYFLIFWLYCALSTFKKNNRFLVLISSLMEYFLRINGSSDEVGSKLESSKTKKHKKKLKIFKFKKTKLLKKNSKKKNNLKEVLKNESNKFPNSYSSKDLNLPGSLSAINQSNSQIKYIDDSVLNNQKDDSKESKDVLQIDFPDKEYINGHFSKQKDEESKSLIEIFKNNSRNHEKSFSSSFFHRIISCRNKEITSSAIERMLNTNKEINSFSSPSEKMDGFEVLKKVEKIFLNDTIKHKLDEGNQSSNNSNNSNDNSSVIYL